MVMTVDSAVSTVSDWFELGSVPICWLLGESNSGKTKIAQFLLKSTDRAHALFLSATNPDQCFQQICNGRSTAALFAQLDASNTKLLVLDGLDILQYSNEENFGQIYDLRLSHLLSKVRNKPTKLRVLITSRLPPPRDLLNEFLTVIELAPHSPTQPDIGEEILNHFKDSIAIEFLASSRKASSGWLLGFLSGVSEIVPSFSTPEPVSKILDEAVANNIVYRVTTGHGGEWFQMKDSVRKRFLSESRAKTIHILAADKLESHSLSHYIEFDPDGASGLFHYLMERVILHRLDAGDIEGAATCYWKRLGNFSQLQNENAVHFGSRICWTLNNKLPPRRVSSELKGFAGAAAIINDWGVHAICTGDAKLSAEASAAAFHLLPKEYPPLEYSTLACHTAQAELLRGNLPEAMRWAELAERYALSGLRKTQGIPTQEVMSAYDLAAYEMMNIAAASDNVEGVVQIFEEMIETHQRARDMLAEYNRSTIILNFPGPTRDVKAEELHEGRAAALVKLVTGSSNEAVRILTSQLKLWSKESLESRQGLTIRLMLLRAQIAAGRYEDAWLAINELRHLADKLDDAAARCQIACANAELLLAAGKAEASLALTDDFLDLASNCDLVLLRNDLIRIRSKALQALSRVGEAAASMDGIQTVPPVLVSRLPKKRRRRAVNRESFKDEADYRLHLHEAALAVIDDYTTKGLPFAIYFRKYGFQVSHGPMELGPQLIENVLQDAMPPGAQVLTVQSHDDISIEYTGAGGRFNRSAPALYIKDEEWREFVSKLIPLADLIISECYMLSEGVRFELEVAAHYDLWDRTVLLLPPQKSYLKLIDNDPLIQIFPRCIWMDSFHTESVAESPLVQDLIVRMEQIAALSDNERQRLIDPAVRDKEYPINLLPIAEHYESNAMSRLQWQSEDERTEYYSFWELFRAAAIRGVMLLSGDDSFDNRISLSDANYHMSVHMLNHEREGDKIIFTGDLEFAEQCAESAYALIRESDGPTADYFFRQRAENQLQSVLEIRRYIEAHPGRCILRPRYGPFPVHRVSTG